MFSIGSLKIQFLAGFISDSDLGWTFNVQVEIILEKILETIQILDRDERRTESQNC